ncbi:MAG: sigma 54-interacting transcriptional regulator [Proteobacteria bacterium]|nr:sigma 54-interacting transcriptional regulator [Pseudomonadota bacterium]
MTLRILHLDDDIIILDRFAKILSSQKLLADKPFSLKSVETSAEFFAEVSSKTPPNIILIDVHLEGTSPTGVDIAATTRALLPASVLLVVSGTKDSKIIRDSLRVGADDFVSKEVDAPELFTRLEAILESRQQGSDALNHPNLQIATDKSAPIIGGTLIALQLRTPALIKSAVNCIYIEGESGTGKEVVANLFAASLPSGTPFVRLNCGSITPTLLASELFGHAKGSFTGAQADKIGLIESANNGWIFLDEVATLPSDAQVALLRAIDNQSIRRVGANVERPVQFRVISATNEPLQELVDAGKFRKDLWQRLRETHISIPPLRKRKEEIDPLIDFFLSTMRNGPYHLAPTVRETLVAYDWQEGNVRELRNVLRAMTEKSIGGLLTPRSIPERIWDTLDGNLEKKGHNSSDGSNHPSQISLGWNGPRPEFEKLSLFLLAEILRQEHRIHGPLTLRGLGKSLGMAKSTVSSKIKTLTDENIMTSEELSKMLRLASQKDESKEEDS